MSNDGTNGVVSGSLSQVTTTALGDQRSRHQRHRRCEDGGCHPHHGHRDARHRAGPVGTIENRLQFAITLAQSQMTNKQAAESRIRDANVAEESANMTQFNILQQSGIAALVAGEPDVGVGAVTAPVSA